MLALPEDAAHPYRQTNASGRKPLVYCDAHERPLLCECTVTHLEGVAAELAKGNYANHADVPKTIPPCDQALPLSSQLVGPFDCYVLEHNPSQLEA